jgi:hypothetical protein
VVERLKADDVQVFYDQDHLADMWGENLIDFLQAVYARRARYAVLFISRHYVEKKWPAHERQAAQDRALQQSSPYILPVRLDDAELPGLHGTISYMDARIVGLDGLVEAIKHKLGPSQAAPMPPSFDGKVPRSPEAVAALLSERPPAWEYLLYAATVRKGIDALEEKYRDHLLQYAPRGGVTLDDRRSVHWLADKFVELKGIIGAFNKVLDAGAQERAFGRRGEPGDADRIIHLGTRLGTVYGELLDWSARIRAMNIPDDDLRAAADIEARFTDQPLEAMRTFASDFVLECDSITERLAAGNRINIKMTITLVLEDALVEEYQAALAAFNRRRRLA